MDRAARLEQFLAILEKREKPVTNTKPFISIVTIYDELNEAQWLNEFLAGLPKVEEGVFELILCKCVPASGVKPTAKAPEIRNGIMTHYVTFPYSQWSFSDARNVAATAASGDWILALDTDEVLMLSQAELLVETCKAAPKNIGAYSVNIYSQVCANPEFEKAPVTRLYRNIDKVSYSCAIHETVMFSVNEIGLEHEYSNVSIFHNGYAQNENVLISKLERNLEMLGREYARYKHSHIKEYMKVHLFRTVKELERFYDAKEKRDSSGNNREAEDYLSQIAARLAA